MAREYLEACIIYDTLVKRGYRVDEIQQKILYRAHRQIEERYLAERYAGDEAFQRTQFDVAREAYMRALALKPEDEYSQEQVKKIELMLANRKQ